MAAVAGSNVARFAVSVKNAEGENDPGVRGRFRFVSTTGTTVCEFGPVPLGAGQTFDLPGWPLVQALRCDVTLDGYRAQPSTQFIPRRGQRIDAPLIAMRDPAHWLPAFQPLDELGPDRFARLLRVVRASDAKKRFGPGTLQLTAAKEETGGATRFLVDVDMDEHGQLALHAIDLFKHTFNGGTHPIDIHELIVAYAARPDGPGAVNLGYSLQRRT